MAGPLTAAVARFNTVPAVRGETVRELLETGVDHEPALLSPGGFVVSHAALRFQVERLAGQLRSVGIRRGDRVGIVLPNGPDAALVLLAVASCATAAPLNPALKQGELRSRLDAMGAKAIIAGTSVLAGSRSEAGRGLLQLGLAGRPGDLRLMGPMPAPAADPEFARPDEDAVLLPTSGTTSEPKLVPLTQRNLVASVSNIIESLRLTPDDRCLNVMPLFHIHGLVAALLSPLAAGGSVVCTPGFGALRFFSWLDEFSPTWYTAVPAMHQMVRSRASRHRDIIARSRLRLVRSCSAVLSPGLMRAIEDLFDVPMIEAYGMTEAAHQVASNPLPPGRRKPGSVGRGTGTEIAVVDDRWERIGAGASGEIVIRGLNVTLGYERSPAANAASFRDGWFRTGDQGFLDDDAYLHLTGRIREIINRGGEKVSPYEVEEVLLLHPAVAQGVAFAVPHPVLQEEVAAAVVLEEGASAGERELREHVASHLAAFKVPRIILILDELPRGPTGKLQRLDLARRLGLVGGQARQSTQVA